MAINPQKFLPGSGSSAIVKASTSTSLVKTNNVSNKSNDITLKIYKKVVKIDKLLKNNFKLTSKQNELDRREGEKRGREKREKQLESPQKFKGFETLKNALPKTGIIDSIKRFIIFTFAGWVFTKLFKFLPKLLDIVKFISPILSWIEKGIGMFFEGLVTFIDLGYKAYDKVRDFTKLIGGENFQKVFDGFSSNLNKFLNLAIIAAMIAARSGIGLGGPGLGAGGRGRGGGSVGIGGRGSGRTRSVDPKTARRFTERFGREAAERKFGKDALKSLGGKYGRSGVTNFARKGLVASLGKGGTKTLLRAAKPLLRGIPLIGGLVEFALSWALGDPVGKAAFRGIGSVLVGLVGAAIGGPIGAGIGGYVGGEVGGVLYDMIFGGKKTSNKVQKKNKGGLIQKNKAKSSVSRPPVRSTSSKNSTKKIKKTKILPGKDVGGKRKIEKLYPNPESSILESGFNWLSSLFGGDKKELEKNRSKLPNTLKALSKVGESLGKSEDWIGALMSAGVQIALGQIPDARAIASAVSSVLTSARSSVSQGMSIVRESISKFADGGVVSTSSYLTNDSLLFQKTLENTIQKRVTDSLRSVKSEIGKSGPSKKRSEPGRDANIEKNRQRGGAGGGAGGGGGGGGPDGGGVEGQTAVTGSANERAILDMLAVAEGTTKSYGVISGGDVNKDLESGKLTVKEVIALGNTFGRPGSKHKWSGATGRYQFMPDTLQNLINKGVLKPDQKFTPELQDKAAIALIRGRGVDPTKPLTKNDIYKLGGEWASVEGGPEMRPGGSYGSQVKYSADQALKIYQEKLNTSKAQPQTSGGTTKPGDLEKGQQIAGQDKPSGKYARLGIPNTDGQDTGADIELFGRRGEIGKTFADNSAEGPYGNRGVEISFPYDLIYFERVPGGRNKGQQSIMTQGSTTRDYKPVTGSTGFGNLGSYYYKDPKTGKMFEVMMGHGNKPFRKFKEGEVIKAGTVVGWQGATGSSDSGQGGVYDHVTFHVNAVDGGDPNPIFNMFVNSLLTGQGAKLTAKLREEQKNKGPIAEKPKGTEAILNGKPVVWDGKGWISSTSPEAKTLKENIEKEKQNQAKLVSQRPWWDKFGLFGGAAAEKERQSKSSSSSTPPKPTSKPNSAMGGGRGSGSSPSTMQGGGLINPSKPNVPNVASRASYETPGGSSMMAILPVVEEVMIPITVGGGGGGGSIPSFPIAGLNNSGSSSDLLRG